MRFPLFLAVILCLFIVVIPVSAQTSGLVAAYGFDEATGTTTADLSGNGNIGTLSSTGASRIAGRFGNAVSLNGSTGIVTVNNAASLNLNSSFTLEAWVKPSTLSGYQSIFMKESSSGCGYYLLTLDNQIVGGFNGGGGCLDHETTTANLSTGNWYHIAAVLDHSTNTFTIYLNGSSVLNVSETAVPVPNTQPVVFGKTGYGERWNGAIDEVRIYNRSLSQAEIQADMNTPLGSAPSDTTPPAISVSGPASGSTLIATTTVTATASDNVAVVGVQFLLDGDILQAEDTASPFSISWNTTTASNGPHALSARARDFAGNTTTSASISVTVDNQAPTGSITINGGNSATNTTAATLTLSAADDSGIVSQMRFSNTGSSFSAAETYAATKAWTLSTGAGTKTVYVQFKDPAGNWSASFTDTITLDTTAPTISAVGSSNITGNSARIAWTTNEVATSQVDYGTTTSYGNTTTLDPTLVTAHSVTLTGLQPQKLYNFRVRSRDAAGNERIGTNVTFTTLSGPDITPPSVTFMDRGMVSPTNSASLNWTVTFSEIVTGVDVSDFSLAATGVSGASISSVTGSGTTYTLTINTGSGSGSLGLNLADYDSIMDAALNPLGGPGIGNGNFIGQIYSLDKTAPFSSITLPLSGATVSGVVSIQAGAADNAGGVGVAGVQFVIDGTDFGPEKTSAPYSILWDTSLIGNGSHALASRARDTLGNSAISASLSVIVGNPPHPIITQPTSGSTLTNTTTVTILYTPTGDLAGYNVNHIHFILDNGPQLMDIPMDGTFQLTNVPAGSHTLQAFLVTADHAKIPGTDAIPVTFSTTVPDTTPPSVTINQSGSQADPTNATPISFAVVFSENVVGFSNADVTIGGTAGATTAAVAGGPMNYTVTISGMTTSGTVIATLAAGIANDLAGNPNTASTSTDNTVTFNNVNPNDPSVIGQWSSAINWPIVAVHAALLPTGSVLAYSDYTPIQAPRVWNPITNAFTSVPMSSVNLFCSAHALLADGRIFVVGGTGVANDVGIQNGNIFNGTTQSWSQSSMMSYPRYYPTVTTLGDGRMLVLGGTTNCTNCIADVPEIYNPVSNTWTQYPSAAMPFRYYPHPFVLPDGRVLVTSADDSAQTTRVLNLNTMTWSVVDPRVLDGHSSAMYLPGKIIKAGTATDSYHPGLPASANTYVLDMNQPSPSWQTTSPMVFPRSFLTLTILADGQVLATGGGTTTDTANSSTAVYEGELWSPVTQSWTTMAKMKKPRQYHSTALLLPDGRVMVAGGGRQTGLNVPDSSDQENAEIYSPPYLFKGPRPAISAAPSVIQFGGTFSVSTPDASRISSVSLIALGSVTHAFNESQRYVPLTFTAVSGGLDIQGPANSNLAPPGYYMLFIVDSNGVPSVASMLRLPSPSEDTQAPSAPSSLNAVSSIGLINLTWSASTDNTGVTGYNVYRSTTPGFTPLASNKLATVSTTSFADASVISGTYYYLIAATDAAGNLSGPSNEAGVAVTADTFAPSVPAGLAATTISSSQINLSWLASSDNVGVAGYDVFRDGSLSPIGSTTGTAFSDNALTASTTYTYAILARDGAGNVSGLSAFASAATDAAPATPPGAVAVFYFDEASGATTSDSSGNNNTGTLSAGVTRVAGKFNNGVSFGGAGDIVVNNAPSLNFSGSFTLSAWVKPNALTGFQAIIMKETTSGCGYYISTNDNQIVGGFNNGGGCLDHETTNANLVTGNWYHIVAVLDRDTNTFKIYLNGALIMNVSENAAPAPNTQPLVFGRSGYAGGNYERWNGGIDAVRIYGRALNASEVQQLFLAQ